MNAHMVPAGRGEPLAPGLASWLGPRRCGRPIMIEPAPFAEPTEPTEPSEPTAAGPRIARVAVVRIVSAAQIIDAFVATALPSARPEGEA